MGQTLSDVNQEYCNEMLIQGHTREEIIESIPAHRRDQFVEDIDKTFIESHYGIKDIWFCLIVGVVIVGSLYLALKIGS